jgi:topoisomerase-4 subunit B
MFPIHFFSIKFALRNLELDMSSDLELEYSKDDIKTLDWLEHMRLRPGMYIGKTGDGTSQDDGIYILLKEIML